MHRPLSCAAIAVLMTGCIESRFGRIDDGPPEAGERVLQVIPDLIDFGEVAAGTVAVESIVISSIGATAVELDPLHVQGSGTFTIVDEQLPESLSSGTSVEVELAYAPATSDDQATVIVSSNATVPQISVDLFGIGVMPDLVFDPQQLNMRSYDGNPVYGSIVARNEGAVDLVVESWVLQGESFDVETELPATLGPGEESVIDVTWYPEVEGTEFGYFWAASNDPDGNEVATLSGYFQLPCLGLHEADTRGYVDIYSSTEGIVVEHIGEDLDVCIDRWYAYVSEQTQDAGAGDPDYDASDIYGESGSIQLSRGERVVFDYASSISPAWWCIEETQVTGTAYDFDFTGAQIPKMLLDTMLSGTIDPNTTVWKDIRDNPVFIVGRQRGWATTVADGSIFVALEVTNLGRTEGSGVVYETIPAGMEIHDISPEPYDEVEDEDGNITYSWEVSLDAAEDTDRDVHTIYDTGIISYSLSLSEEACAVRSRVTEPVVQWTDSAGLTRQAKGSPFIIECW